MGWRKPSDVDPGLEQVIVIADKDGGFLDPETIAGTSVPGSQLRYEKVQNVSLNKYASGFTDVYSITERSVVQEVLFSVNSNCVYLQIEIDGTPILPSPDGLLLSYLDGFFGPGNSSHGAQFNFSLAQYGASSETWLWRPPDSVLAETSFKIRMKSSTGSSSRDCDDLLVARRVLV